MRYVSLDQVQPGDKLARSIYSSDGVTLLQADVHLTVGMIHKLRQFGVSMVYIADPMLDDVKMEDLVSETTRREAMANLSMAVQCVQAGKDVDFRGLQKSVTNIVDEALRNRKVLLNLAEIRTTDNQMFVHSLNVCMMATVMGISLGYNTSQLKELAIGALLHDVGKAVKEGDGTLAAANGKEAHHTWVGFNWLRKKHDMSIVSAHVALQHHEWVNGEGEPRGLSGSEIHDYAKIVAIANYYDNLISPLSGGETYHPYEATERIMALANRQFDHNMVICFLRSVATYPTGSSIKLSTGDVGVVIGQNKGLPSRPVVRVIKKERGLSRQLDDGHQFIDVDLSDKTTVFITGILE